MVHNTGCRSRALRGGGREVGSSDIDTLGVLSSARVAGAALCLASGKTVAVGDAVIVILGADEVRNCLGILRRVGRLAIAADTTVLESILRRLSVRWLSMPVTGTRTTWQSLDSGVPDVPDIWRQRRGHAAICD